MLTSTIFFIIFHKPTTDGNHGTIFIFWYILELVAVVASEAVCGTISERVNETIFMVRKGRVKQNVNNG